MRDQRSQLYSKMLCPPLFARSAIELDGIPPARLTCEYSLVMLQVLVFDSSTDQQLGQLWVSSNNVVARLGEDALKTEVLLRGYLFRVFDNKAVLLARRSYHPFLVKSTIITWQPMTLDEVHIFQSNRRLTHS